MNPKLCFSCQQPLTDDQVRQHVHKIDSKGEIVKVIRHLPPCPEVAQEAPVPDEHDLRSRVSC